MKKLLYAFITLILLLLVVPNFIDWSYFKEPIITTIKDNTGFEIDLKGPVCLSLLPSPYLSAKGVAIKNKPGGKANSLVELKSISLGVHFFPLLKGNIEVSKVELIEPVINLETFKNGENNWDTKPTKASSDSKLAAADSTSVAKNDTKTLSFSFQKVIITDGQVAISNFQTNSHYEIKNINFNGSLDSLIGIVESNAQKNIVIPKFEAQLDSMKITGNLLAKDQHAEMNLTITEGASKIDISAKGKNDPTHLWDGTVVIQSEKPQGFLKWFGLDQNASYLQGGVNISTHLKTEEGIYTLSALKFRMGHLDGSGVASIKFDGKKPYVKADLSLNKLDLNAFMGIDQKKSETGKSQVSIPPANSNVASSSARWSKDKWNLEPLKSINADLTFSIGEIKYDEYQLSQVMGALHLKDGNLQLSSFQAQGYDGHLSGDMVIQPDKLPSVQLNFGIQNLNLALLKKIRQTPLKKATLNTSLKVSVRGDNTFDAVNSMSGNMQFNLTQGVIEAFDVKKFIADMKQLKSPTDVKTLMDDLKRKADTSFAHIKADFTVQNGVASSQNIEFLSDEAMVTGKGCIDLPRWGVDMNMQIKIKELSKIPPFGMKIAGDLDSPSFSIDPASLIKVLLQDSANHLVDKAVNSVGGKVGDILQGVLGGGKSKKEKASAPVDQQPQQQEEAIKPEKILKSLLGGKF